MCAYEEKDCWDLLTLQSLLKESIQECLPSHFWVRAEVASISLRRNGHCYLDLSQSEKGSVVAQVKAIIWAGVYRQIGPYFESETGVPLSAGQQVLFLVSVNYSPLYGLSLIIDDVDPQYTIGDAARKREETLGRLRSEGLTEFQKERSLPMLPRRFAVISARDAAGYRDFVRHLSDNSFGLRFEIELFPSPMQGPDCAEGIESAVKAIEMSKKQFDAVLMLRGGGGKLDLACYDEYRLCAALARCPFPVLTAIGHDQDVHLCDVVAFQALKTPTALADYFIDIFAGCKAMLDSLKQRLDGVLRTRTAIMRGRLDVLSARLEAADPRRVLDKGFALIVGPDGRKLTSAASSKEGDVLTIMFRDGTIKVTVNEKITDDRQAVPAES